MNTHLNLLIKPIHIIDSEQWRDGGSIFIVLQGANKEEFSFWLNRNPSYVIGSLFYSENSKQLEGVVIPNGSILEKQIVDILKEWLNQNTNPSTYIKVLEELNLYSKDPYILARRRYYASKIIESIETNRNTYIMGTFSKDIPESIKVIDRKKYEEMREEYSLQ